MLSGAKSGPRDAGVIAGYLRLRQHWLRSAALYAEETKALRVMPRARDGVMDMQVAAASQPGALLDAHWPGGKAIFADLDSRIALGFLTRYPTGAAAADLTADDIAEFCPQTGCSGKRPAAVLLQPLRSAPSGVHGTTLTAAVAEAVLALVSTVRTRTAAIRDLDKSVSARLGEWGDCRQACDGPDSIAAPGGVTPVTEESGKHRAVDFR